MKLFEFYLSGAVNGHSLEVGELDSLAKKTEGYSCDDISNICREALFCSLRGVTHFKVSDDGFFTPCLETEIDAIRMTLNDVPGGKLRPPPISMVSPQLN